jgi:hypothetical protein
MKIQVYTDADAVVRKAAKLIAKPEMRSQFGASS